MIDEEAMPSRTRSAAGARIAYFFWHRPRIEPAEYEPALSAFHAALDPLRPAGILPSRAFRMSELPWVKGEGTGYEDIYPLSDFGSLRALKEVAVGPQLIQVHDHVASALAAGAGGLYGLIGGTNELLEPIAIWLSKPNGVGYDEFRAALRAHFGPAAAVWQRELALGPAPEFLVALDRRPDRPVAWPILSIERTRIWPSP